MQLTHNSLLQGGKYRIERVLGQGGFGITYLGEQVALGRKVAIKEFFMKEYCNRDAETSHVSVGSQGSREAVDRFKLKFIKEAQLIAALNHPNIIRIHDIFEENGTAYYIMEYQECGSLSDYLEARGALDEAEALSFIRQIADALKYIHERKINHLDVKPGNILLNEDNNAVLIDFGLSKRYDDEGNQTSTTPVGISHGYAPLEQYKRGGVGVFSPATDIYSLGATLYKLLTGNTPPEANDVMESKGVASLGSNVSKKTSDAVRKAMQPSRQDRPQSIDEFLALLGNEKVKREKKTKTAKTAWWAKAGKGNKVEQTNTDEATVFGDDAGGEQSKERVVLKRGRRNWKKWLAISGGAIVSFFVLIMAIGIFSGEEDEAYELELKHLEDLNKSIGGYEKGYPWVDLGLSVKWATYNIGALFPGNYGDYYAWGETIQKSEYTLANSKTTGKNLGDISGNPQYDVARKAWKGKWRMPTSDEFRELDKKCTWQWTNINGHDGYKVTGPNKNSIFLPAAVYFEDSRWLPKYYGKYWTSSPVESSSNTDAALSYFFQRDFHYSTAFDRYEKHSVRAVME